MSWMATVTRLDSRVASTAEEVQGDEYFEVYVLYVIFTQEANFVSAEEMHCREGDLEGRSC